MTNVRLKRKISNGWEYINPLTQGDCVTLKNGKTVQEELSTLESDCFSPTVVQTSAMSKVGVGENGVDISANVQEGYVKSAILKGNTLVNVICGEPIVKPNQIDFNLVGVSPGKTYLAIFKLECDVSPFSCGILSSQTSWNVDSNKVFVGLNKVKLLVTNNPVIGFRVRHNSPTSATTFNVHDVMLIEYQEGMENWDIPYFEGMQSVKMPVLTTTGKNLLNINNCLKYKVDNFEIEHSGQGSYTFKNLYSGAWQSTIVDKLKLKANTSYTLSYEYEIIESTGSLVNGVCISLRANGINISGDALSGKSLTFTTDKEYSEVNVHAFTTDSAGGMNKIRFFNVQIEENSVATSFESYKSNTLSTPSDLVLRGIGDVKDTLDVNTGEVVQRIGEVIFDGSEAWTIGKTSVNTVCFQVGLSSLNINVLKNNFITNYLIKNVGLWGSDVECATINGSFTHFQIRLNKTKASTVDEVKQYLNQNPLTVHLELASPIIKTVDLTPSGTNPTTRPYVWDDGHIQLSSEEGSLIPSLEYSVTTSRGGQIIQNTQSIAKQDKRVYDLEMLLINASVDEAYQRLSLQNDVMIMSRESETTLSPLRYVMLQRLIEEGAYETQDMLDKLDVFFMYGEITDEQYFELSGIVLGITTDTDLDITEEVE